MFKFLYWFRVRIMSPISQDWDFSITNPINMRYNILLL